MSDWGKTALIFVLINNIDKPIPIENDSDSPAETPAAPAAKKHVPVKSKWDGEDEEDNGPVVSSSASI